MTVYVDDMHRYDAGRFRRMKMSHMIADTDEELHAMAARIGISRRWYQGDHYDISLGKRALAVTAGAVEITWRQCGAMMFVRRRTGRLPAPDRAEDELRRKRRNARIDDAVGAAFMFALMAAASVLWIGLPA